MSDQLKAFDQLVRDVLRLEHTEPPAHRTVRRPLLLFSLLLPHGPSAPRVAGADIDEGGRGSSGRALDPRPPDPDSRLTFSNQGQRLARRGFERRAAPALCVRLRVGRRDRAKASKQASKQGKVR